MVSSLTTSLTLQNFSKFNVSNGSGIAALESIPAAERELAGMPAPQPNGTHLKQFIASSS
jgi:hypothetical protein